MLSAIARENGDSFEGQRRRPALDLTRPIREVARAIADDTGEVEFAIDVPPDAEPGDLWLQILEIDHGPTVGPAISNVMALVVF